MSHPPSESQARPEYIPALTRDLPRFRPRSTESVLMTVPIHYQLFGTQITYNGALIF